MSLELGVAKWELAFGTTPGGVVQRRTLEMKDRQTVRERLQTLIANAKAAFGLPAAVPVRSCYEAGRDGFWVHRLLATLAVENCVVDSSSIEVNRRARQAKTDPLDATRLLRMLLRYWSGERDLWHVCWVPSVAEEDVRHQTRLIKTLTQERTRWRNRIHAALILHGVRLAIGPRFPE
jgi:transposase